MSSTKTPFTAPVDIRFADTDANGHVFFANYFTYFEIAFYRYLESIGCSFEWFIENGMNLYYVEATAQYKAAITYGDPLQVGVEVTRLGNTSLTIEFTAVVAPDENPAATGKIVAVVVDNQSEKPVPVPEPFKAAV
jgi:acyl-CoA thioester hydrolase